MIAYLKGQIVEKTETDIVLLCQDIGYQLTLHKCLLHEVSLGEVRGFSTYLHVREDVVQLFGFSESKEKEGFLLLTSVSGVGPKVALTLLGETSYIQLMSGITNEDLAYLMTLPGIGKKTAQRLILELKDKAQIFLATISPEALATVGTVPSVRDPEPVEEDDVYYGLLALGYQDKEIKQIYPALAEFRGQADAQTLIKKALQLLMRRN